MAPAILAVAFKAIKAGAVSADGVALDMAFDLWEGGQYTYVCALGVLMVLLLVAMAFTARKLGAKIGIAE